jgi:hypothetical protein
MDEESLVEKDNMWGGIIANLLLVLNHCFIYLVSLVFSIIL